MPFTLKRPSLTGPPLAKKKTSPGDGFSAAPKVSRPGIMVMSDPVERVPGRAEITSPSITASRRVDWTSTTGLSPVTMMVSVRLPTRMSIGIVRVAEPISSTPSRLHLAEALRA